MGKHDAPPAQNPDPPKPPNPDTPPKGGGTREKPK